MTNDTTVERHLANLLGQGESLADFASWLMNALWSIELEGSDHDVALAARIVNRQGEYSSGHISLDELMVDLREDAAEIGVELRETSAA